MSGVEGQCKCVKIITCQAVSLSLLVSFKCFIILVLSRRLISQCLCKLVLQLFRVLHIRISVKHIAHRCYVVFKAACLLVKGQIKSVYIAVELIYNGLHFGFFISTFIFSFIQLFEPVIERTIGVGLLFIAVCAVGKFFVKTFNGTFG